MEVRESLPEVVTLGPKSEEATPRKHSIYVSFLTFRGQFRSRKGQDLAFEHQLCPRQFALYYLM